MPFIYSHFENIDDPQLELHFGSGDIEMRVGIDPISCLSFSETSLKPIEDWNKGSDPIPGDPGLKQSELPTNTILFYFKRTESIDQLIEVLQQVKKNMLAEMEKGDSEP